MERGMWLGVGARRLWLNVPADFSLPAIREYVAPFGLDAYLGGPPDMQRPINRRHPVAAIGPDAGLSASIYSSAMRRDLVRFERWSDFPAWFASTTVDSVFLFVPESMWDLERAAELNAISARAERGLGILPVAEDTRSAVLSSIRLTALRVAPRDFPHRLLAYSDLMATSESLPADFRDQAFGMRDSGLFLSKLKLGAECTIICSHSNGADLRLGRRVVCVQANDGPSAPSGRDENFYPCQGGGACLREGISPREFIAPNSLKTSILVALTCFGVVPYGGLIDRRFTLAAALFEAPHIQAIVAPYTLSDTPQEAIYAASMFLNAGCSVGQLAQQLNRTGQQEYVCLGDPTLRLEGTLRRVDSTLRLFPVASSTQRIKPGVAGTISLPGYVAPTEQLENKAAPLHNFGLSDPGPTAEDSGSEATSVASWRDFYIALLERLAALKEDAESQKQSRFAAERIRRRDGAGLDLVLCEALAYWVSWGVYLHKFWPPAEEYTALTPSGLIHSSCGNRLLSQSRGWGSDGLGRTIWYCVRCGFSGDTPDSLALPDCKIEGGEAISAWPFLSRESLAVCGSIEGVGNSNETPMSPTRVLQSVSDGVIRMPLNVSRPMAGLRFATLVFVTQGDFMVVRVPFKSGLEPTTPITGESRRRLGLV